MVQLNSPSSDDFISVIVKLVELKSVTRFLNSLPYILIEMAPSSMYITATLSLVVFNFHSTTDNLLSVLCSHVKVTSSDWKYS